MESKGWDRLEDLRLTSSFQGVSKEGDAEGV